MARNSLILMNSFERRANKVKTDTDLFRRPFFFISLGDDHRDLFCLALVGNGFHKLFDLFGISQEIIFLQVHLIVELEDVWNTSG